MTNGDKIVLDKLDSCISASGKDEDDDDFAVLVNHKLLLSEDSSNLGLVKDLLVLPRKRTSAVLTHPVVTTFIGNCQILLNVSPD